MVSTWKMIRRSVLVSAFVTSSSTREQINAHYVVELAQRCVVAFGFSLFSLCSGVALCA